MIERRAFLGGILAALTAPAIVRSDSLMKLTPKRIFTLYGDGLEDDTVALQALMDGREVVTPYGAPASLSGGLFLISNTLVFRRDRMCVSGLTLEASDNFLREAPMLRVEGHRNVFDRLYLDGNGRAGGIHLPGPLRKLEWSTAEERH